MKNLNIFFFSFMLLLVWSCDDMSQKDKVKSSEPLKKESKQEKVLTSLDKEEMLKKRVFDFWQAKVNSDREKQYDFYDPFFKFHVSKDNFKTMGTNINYENPQIQEVIIEGNVASSKVTVVYFGELPGRLKPVAIEKTPAEINQTWLFMDENWYLEFIDNINETKFTRY